MTVTGRTDMTATVRTDMTATGRIYDSHRERTCDSLICPHVTVLYLHCGCHVLNGPVTVTGRTFSSSTNEGASHEICYFTNLRFPFAQILLIFTKRRQFVRFSQESQQHAV